MSSSAFSFHCMICFEEFDTQTNYPVVLPCGHTYVCISCANRLDKCMECRTPLYLKIETPPPPPSPSPEYPQQKENRYEQTGRYGTPTTTSRLSYSSVRSSPGMRSGYGNNRVLSRHTPNSHGNGQLANKPPQLPQAVKKERLPLPKNAVLLSLIQASEPARRRAELQANQPPSQPQSPTTEILQPSPERNLPNFSKPSPLFIDNSCSGDHDDVELEEEHKIRVGTYLSGGPCGTYAVAAKSGLLVYPTLFEHSLQKDQDDDVDRNVEELVKQSYKSKYPPIQNDSQNDLSLLERSHTWVESHEDEHVQDGVEAAVGMPLLPNNGGPVPFGTPVRKGANIEGATMPITPLTATKKLHRQFSHGSYPLNQDDFDRPLMRLKYGDRVQVVSMDVRGWVKLARGYGYIRLENDKQLVKVGGSSDKACQIEAVLHELSIERNRLKTEQKKLERLAAGLMIDLQSSLMVDEDHVVESAPEGFERSDSEVSLLPLRQPPDRKSSTSSADDLDISTRSRTLLTSPRAKGTSVDGSEQPREIRTVKSHSPGRSGVLLPSNGSKAPPSPPNGSFFSSSTASTPTRVNFRTGLSGHRALSSSHAHPHDFIDRSGPSRSMSNHAGLSSKKLGNTRGRSIY